ncbi:MAG: ABC transporter substrate-binding protein [Lachnospiraceae bacterium]|uniref:ABC transporter substrate-binding protein n=1 Tax=Candidatus Enterocloster excrementigallinarum TaxID=2838558 RepID=A0A9D2PR05_9FIRM|nr:ABC transporter substrate-binding protein [Lachnospiraceae bacterium]HJC65647.1 ABC transporter substrate-binding protein [Candidatus Enterocloster excrementigallinarum]
MKKRLISVLLCTALAATMVAGCTKKNEVLEQSAAAEGSESAQTEASAPEQTQAAAEALEEFGEIPADVDTEQIITYAQGADPRGLDPALIDDGESSKPICQMYEGLLKYGDNNTEVEPCLAESWEVSEDGLTYTFKLRQGVKFHDGTDFNAEAVKYNVDRQTVNKTEDMLYADFVFGDVAACNVIDDYTVEIVLNKVSTPFLNNLAMSLGAPMVSPTACEANNNNLNEAPCGTGPYKFVRWDKNEAVVMERNEDYWGEKGVAKQIVFKTITDNSARVVALTNGEVDIIDGIDANVVDQVTSAGALLNMAEGMNINYLAYNTQRITDPEVRKALSQAVNVPELVASLYRGYASEATSILPTFMPGYSADVKQVSYDPEAAAQTLADKGVTELHMLAYTNPRPYNTATGQTLAEALQGYYEKVGVTCSIDSYDWTTYKEKVGTGDYDVCLYGWIGDNGDPDNFMNLLASEDIEINVAQYSDEEFNTMLAEAASTPNGEERNAIYAQMEQKIADECVWLPISHQENLSAYLSNVHNYIAHPTGNVFLSQTYKQ